MIEKESLEFEQRTGRESLVVTSHCSAFLAHEGVARARRSRKLLANSSGLVDVSLPQVGICHAP